MTNHLTLEQWLAFNFNPLQLALICIGIPAFLSLAAILGVRWFNPSSTLKRHHDISGPIFSGIGTVYGVLLALVVTNTWSAYDKTATNIVSEARCLQSLYYGATAFPPETAHRIQKLLDQYRNQVVHDEWVTMARGEKSPEVSATMTELLKAYLDFRPSNSTEQPFYSQSVSLLREIASLRTSRLDDSQSGLIPFLWIVLIAGGTLTVGFCLLFGAENFPTHALMIVGLSTLISLGYLTIVTLDFPFTGAAAIPPDSFLELKLN